ncbi:UDP-N-acetylglucosamine 2-epimerase [Streptomyces sp. NPDC032161]|uniref:UDP-N-acetyl glucosamine 2-epimerase n=1 Tax=Streptomyces sp. NPDC032161 TaxID=3155253 RepID=UPI0033EEFB9C
MVSATDSRSGRSFVGQAVTPEEANRRLIAPLADLHCAPTATAAAHLLREGIEPHRVVITGNTVVEATLESLPAEAEVRWIVAEHAVVPGRYVLATIHRPENTDDAARLAQILDQLAAMDLPVLLPLHPRTRAAVDAFGLRTSITRLRRIEPLDHAAFLALAQHCRLLVSDSGGIQEECTVLKRPLVVVRNSTERPEAVQAGFARLAQPGHELARVLRELLDDEAGAERLARLPSPYGTGQASADIVTAVRSRYLHAGPAAPRTSRPRTSRSRTSRSRTNRFRADHRRVEPSCEAVDAGRSQDLVVGAGTDRRSLRAVGYLVRKLRVRLGRGPPSRCRCRRPGDPVTSECEGRPPVASMSQLAVGQHG